VGASLCSIAKVGRSFEQVRTPHSGETRCFRTFRAIATTWEALFVGAKTFTVRGSVKFFSESPSGGHSIGLPRVFDQPLDRTVIAVVRAPERAAFPYFEPGATRGSGPPLGTGNPLPIIRCYFYSCWSAPGAIMDHSPSLSPYRPIGVRLDGHSPAAVRTNLSQPQSASPSDRSGLRNNLGQP